MALRDFGLDEREVTVFIERSWRDALLAPDPRRRPLSVKPATYVHQSEPDPYRPGARRAFYAGGYRAFKVARTGLGHRTYRLSGLLHESLMAEERPAPGSSVARIAVSQKSLPYWGTRSGLTTVDVSEFSAAVGNDIFDALPIDDVVDFIKARVTVPELRVEVFWNKKIM